MSFHGFALCIERTRGPRQIPLEWLVDGGFARGTATPPGHNHPVPKECSRTHTPRLHRSELAVPGSNVRMLEKAPGLGADIVMLDLEDAVAPDDKPQARSNVIQALRELDLSRSYVSLRINGLDTHSCYRALVDVIEGAGPYVDTIMIPKASCAGDVHLVATLLTQIEGAQ